MIFRENMLKDGRLFAKDTDVIPIRIEESRAKEISNEFTKLLKSFFSKTKASDLFRDLGKLDNDKNNLRNFEQHDYGKTFRL